MSNQNCKPLVRCVACASRKLKLTLDLGSQPLANSYKDTAEESQEEFPLAINRCLDCYHIQLTHAVNPDLMFEEYLYVSGTSKTMHDHMKEFAKYANNIAFHPKDRKSMVLDIGCNDGTQLEYFKQLGYHTIGVDPAGNLYGMAESKVDEMYQSYFDDSFVEGILKWDYLYDIDLITAQNVFAHTAEPLTFLKNAKKIMSKDTTLLIQTSQANMIKNNEFDTIYHEHISFFNIQSMDKLCKRAGLNLVAVHMMPIHGTSFIFVIRKDINSVGVEELINEEREAGLYSEETYINYEKKCRAIAKTLKDEIDYVRQNAIGWNTVGYGAAAKGMTLINFAKLKLDFIIDDNPLKQGKFTPGSSIPIVGPDVLPTFDTALFVPLAWNFYKEIKEKIKSVRDNKYDRFITYFPEVKMEK